MDGSTNPIGQSSARPTPFGSQQPASSGHTNAAAAANTPFAPEPSGSSTPAFRAHTGTSQPFGGTSALGQPPAPAFGGTGALGQQSNSAFGSTSTSSPFGSSTSPYGSQTAAPTFGQATFGNQSVGTRIQTYVQTPDPDGAASGSQAAKLDSISAMPAYKGGPNSTPVVSNLSLPQPSFQINPPAPVTPFSNSSNYTGAFGTTSSLFQSTTTNVLGQTTSQSQTNTTPSIFNMPQTTNPFNSFSSISNNSQSAGLVQSSPTIGQQPFSFNPQTSTPAFNTSIFNRPNIGMTGGQLNPTSSPFVTPTFQQPAPVQPTSFSFQPQAQSGGSFGVSNPVNMAPFGQQTTTQSNMVTQPTLVSNPFGTLPAMPHMSIGNGGSSSPSVQYGISSLLVAEKPYPSRTRIQPAPDATSSSQPAKLDSISAMPAYRGEGLVLQMKIRYEDGTELVFGNLKASSPVLHLGSSLAKDVFGNAGGQKRSGLHMVVLDKGEIKDEASLLFNEGLPVCARTKKCISDEEGKSRQESVAETSDEQKSNINKYSLTVRIWPLCHFAVLSLSVSGKWRLTRKYSMEWSRPHNEEESFKWSRTLPYVEFSGQLVYSQKLEMYVQVEMTPGITEYQPLTFLGQGATGAVHQGICQNSSSGTMPCAIKVKPSPNFVNEDSEAKILSSFTEKNITGFYQAWTVPGNFDEYTNCNSSDTVKFPVMDQHIGVNTFFYRQPVLQCIFIQMEYCPGTLVSYIKSARGPNANMSRAWFLFGETVATVKTVHDGGVVHNDLKPDNIFVVSESQIKIGDFGQALLNGEKYDGILGTIGYAAPELNNVKIASSKGDIFALGSILFALFENCEEGYDRAEAFYKLSTGKIIQGWPGDKDLLMKLIGPPSLRPSADDILEYLEKRVDGVKE